MLGLDIPTVLDAEFVGEGWSSEPCPATEERVESGVGAAEAGSAYVDYTGGAGARGSAGAGAVVLQA